MSHMTVANSKSLTLFVLYLIIIDFLFADVTKVKVKLQPISWIQLWLSKN